LVLFSGSKGFVKDNTYQDLWFYDIAKNQWEEKPCHVPGRWQCPSAFNHEKGLLMVQGGMDGNFKSQEDTWIFDLKKNKWRKGDNHKNDTMAYSGACDLVSGNMIVFGGLGKDAVPGKKAFCDLFALDGVTGKWSEIKLDGEKPEGGAYHAAAWCPDGKYMLLFGGTKGMFNSPMRKNLTWLLRLYN